MDGNRLDGMSSGKIDMQARKLSADRKEEIMFTTLDLAFEVGPDNVTTGMIAARLGLSQPAIYKHFPKKQDIWQAAIDTLCVEISENIRVGINPDRHPLDNLRRLVLGHLRIVTKFPALPEIMTTRDPTGGMSEFRRRFLAEMSGFRSALVHCLDETAANGGLRTGLRAEDAVTLVIGIVQSLALRLIISRDPSPLVEDGERLLDLQLALIVSEGSTL